MNEVKQLITEKLVNVWRFHYRCGTLVEIIIKKH